MSGSPVEEACVWRELEDVVDGCWWSTCCYLQIPELVVTRVSQRVEVFALRRKRWPTRDELLAVDGLSDGFGGVLLTGEVDGAFFVVNLGADHAVGARCGRWGEEDVVWWSDAPPWRH